MLMHGIVVGVGLLGGIVPILSGLLSFLGVIYILAVQWSRSGGGPGAAMVVVVMSFAYFVCPLAFYCFCCQGVVR